MKLLGTMIYGSDKRLLLVPSAEGTNARLAPETNKIFWPARNSMNMGDYSN